MILNQAGVEAMTELDPKLEAVARAMFDACADEVTFDEAKEANDQGYRWICDQAQIAVDAWLAAQDNSLHIALKLTGLIIDHAAFSQITFGNDDQVGPLGPIKHLHEETKEVAETPTDPTEYVDLMFLVADAIRRFVHQSDMTLSDFVEVGGRKLETLKARDWPEPKDGEPRFHVKKAQECVPVGDYLVWSIYQGAWWGPEQRGYSLAVEGAGRYSRTEALSIAHNSRDGWRDNCPLTEIMVAVSDLPETYQAALTKGDG